MLRVARGSGIRYFGLDDINGEMVERYSDRDGFFHDDYLASADGYFGSNFE